MNAIILLRAIGGAAVPVAAPADLPSEDPMAAGLLRRFKAAGIWRLGCGLDLIHTTGRVNARVFLTEFDQADRETGRQEANRMKDALRLAMQLEGAGGVFTDALWCERGTRGWAVIGRGMISTTDPIP